MKVKNRAWVKNAAIIFLSVLLVLTFFSNTILNRSLPEVAGQNANSGEISTAVRGSGTVTANEAYSLSIDSSREITKVHVKTGDIVEAGQVVFELEPSDSTELDTAIETLETLQYEYNKKILTLSKDYELEELNYKLEDALEAQEKSIAAAAVLESAKKKNETAQEALKLANEGIDELEERIAELNDEITAGIDEDIMTYELKQLKKKLDDAKQAYDDAKKMYDEGGGTVDLTMYIQAVAAAENVVGTTLEAAEKALRALYPNVDGTTPDLKDGALAYQNYFIKAADPNADADLVNSLLQTALNHNEHKDVQAVKNWKNAQKELTAAKQMLDAMSSGSSNEANLKENVERAERNLNNAQKAWDDATTGIRVEAKQEREKLKAELKTKQTALTPISKAATEAEADLKKAETDASTTPEEAAETVRLAQRDIERKMDELESGEALQNLELERDRDAIADQQEVVRKLREKETATEVTTRYSGTVLSVDVMVGDTTAPDKTLATVEINGKGYTMSFSVSNEEVQRVRIGDIATISSWGRSDIVCTLAAIRTDRDNPTRRKILEFDITGEDVTAGQNLEISIGTRTQYYNYVVPNSAIREDADGKFVLIADAKQTPLGTRYIATRYDVTVVDQDTRNSAITGDFEWSPFVITTSSKPIEPNTQVRLV